MKEIDNQIEKKVGALVNDFSADMENSVIKDLKHICKVMKWYVKEKIKQESDSSTSSDSDEEKIIELHNYKEAVVSCAYAYANYLIDKYSDSKKEIKKMSKKNIFKQLDDDLESYRKEIKAKTPENEKSKKTFSTDDFNLRSIEKYELDKLGWQKNLQQDKIKKFFSNFMNKIYHED